MDSYDSDQRLILQGVSRSTRLAFLCTASCPAFTRWRSACLACLRSYLVVRLLLPSGSHLATDATPSIGRRRVSCFWDTGRFFAVIFLLGFPNLCTAPISNLQSFAPLIFAIFLVIFAKFSEFSVKSVIFRRDFHRILPELRQIANDCQICLDFAESWRNV